MLKRIKENKYFIVGFVLVLFYLLSDCIFDNYIISYTNANYNMDPFDSVNVVTEGPNLTDVADSTLPSKYRIFYDDDKFGMWDSDVALGVNVKAVADLLYPGNLVYFLPLNIAMGIKCILEFLVGFVAMYMFMKSLGVKKYSAAMTGIVYTFSSALVVWLGWPHSDVIALAPLLFFSVEKLLSTIQIKYMLLISLVTYTMLMAAMPTYVAYFMYLAGIYIVVFTIKKHWKNKRNIFVVGGMFAFSIILAVVMSMPYTIELLEQVVGNGYASTRENYSQMKLSANYLRTFLFPYVRDGLSAHINESTMYLGILPIALMPLCVVNNKNKKRNIFFIISSLAVLMLIFTDALNIVFTKLPAVNTSLKYRVIALLLFTMSVPVGNTLNDIIENGSLYWSKKWLFAIQIVWCAAVLYVSTEGIYRTNLPDLQRVTVFMLVSLVCIVLLARKSNKVIMLGIALVVIFDSVGFAKAYLPYVDASADVIPKATDSVQYMIDNTADEERIAGIGAWNLFPNTNVYYNLNDIRIHGFSATNRDFTTFYERIDDNAYDSNTRVEFEKIDNYELLKYIGVKYVYSDVLGRIEDVTGDTGNKSPIGIIRSDTVIKEEIEIKEGATGILIYMSNFGSTPSGRDNFTVNLYNGDGNKLFEKKYSTEDISDNKYFKTDVSGLGLAPGRYIFEMNFSDMADDTITLWTGNASGEQFEMNGEVIPGNIVISATYKENAYNIVYEGQDGLQIGVLDKYADKAELVETIIVKDDDEAVLNTMSEEYLKNTMFVTNESGIGEYNSPLRDGEHVTLERYDDEYIKIKCTTECERYVIINDYYTDDWCAYVNGKKVDVEKVNYLVRAVKVPAGEDIIIEMKYEPSQIKILAACFAVGAALWIIIFIFRNKLQLLIDKMVVKEMDEDEKNTGNRF